MKFFKEMTFLQFVGTIIIIGVVGEQIDKIVRTIVTKGQEEPEPKEDKGQAA